MQKKYIKVFLGPILYVLCICFLPHAVFNSLPSRAAIGTVVWMAAWWIMAPVDFAVTAFLPIAINALIPMADMSDVIGNYASETILLLLGASFLTVSWEETGLDKRIAARFLALVGGNLRQQLFFWFLLSALLSSILPNAVVCATITPIAVSMLRFIGEGNISTSRKGSLILIAIVYAAGVGGLASPLGGAMNLVTVDYLQQITGKEYMYSSWVYRFFPIMVLLISSNIIYLIFCCNKEDELGGSRQYFIDIYKNLPKMLKTEKLSLFLFLCATFLSFARPLYQKYIPGLKPAYIFIIAAILAFFIKKEDGTPLLKWKIAEKKVIWDLIYVFAGGLAVGALINKSGAASAIGEYVASLGLTGGFITVVIIIIITIVLSDLTSNTATAAVSIPVVISIVQGVGLNPIPYIYIASIGVNLSYMFPTSIRAIPVGYGLEPQYMLKHGIRLTLITIILMSLSAYALLKYWPAFSTI